MGIEGTPEQFFDGSADGLRIHRAIASAVTDLGPCTTTVTTSQIAFRRQRGFAYVWRPGRYVRSTVPAVLSLAVPWRWTSDRFTEVVHPSPRVWMHHLELNDVAEVDGEVRTWLAAAYDAAGDHRPAAG